MKDNKNGGGIHYAWFILAISAIVLGVFVPIVTSLSNSWQIAVTEDLGFSRTAYSISGTITQAVGIFLGPVASYYLTKYNFKKLWTAFAILFSAGVFGFSLAQNQYHFYISAFVVGVCFIATTSIPIMMMINNWFYEKRGLATSIAVSGISAGGAILSPLISRVISNYGWRTSYRMYSLIILVIAIVFGIFLIYLKPEDRGMKPYGFKKKEKIEKENLGGEVSKSLEVGLSLSASITCSFFIFLILGSITNGLANGASLQFPPALQQALGVERSGSIISIYLLIGVFGKLLLGEIADRFGIYKALIFGSITLSLSFVSMLFIDTSWGPWALAVIFGLGLAMGTVIPPLVTSSIYNREMYGEAYGFVQSGMQIGAAIGPLFVSFIFDRSTSYYIAWIVNIVLAILTGVLWYIAHQRAKKYKNKNVK
ncbi:MFS transporter [Helcococcus sueciensis]|uniref:MFS transporter n=1 Tax=Helcococcus sueciensis TaxID=241555 RepID=UPI00040E7B22|nr:MFS transporter [Helcococcus sueciensis]